MYTTFAVETYVCRSMRDIRNAYSREEWKELVEAFGDEEAVYEQIRLETSMNIEDAWDEALQYRRNTGYSCPCCGDRDGFVRFHHNGKVFDSYGGWLSDLQENWRNMMRHMEWFLVGKECAIERNRRNPDLITFFAGEFFREEKIVVHEALFFEEILRAAEVAFEFLGCRDEWERISKIRGILSEITK